MLKSNDKSVYRQFGKSGNTVKRGFVFGKDGVSSVDIIIIVVATVVIIVSGIFLFSNFKTLKLINDEITEMKLVLEQKQNTLDKLIELGKNEDLLKENYERNLLYLPKEKNEIGIIADVTGVVGENGGLFRTIKYDEEISKENGIIDIPFTLRVNGTYEALNGIVTDFGKTDRLYVMDSIIIVESSEDNSILTADLKMHTYYKE